MYIHTYILLIIFKSRREAETNSPAVVQVRSSANNKNKPD